MKINVISNDFVTFQNSKVQKKEKYQRQLEKQKYIDSNMKPLEDIILFLGLGAMSCGVYDSINPLEKNHKPSKFAVGLLITAFTLLIIKCIKQIKLSNQYDKEVADNAK